MVQKLSFTFEELRTTDIRDVDVYVAAGLSSDLDCQILGCPPAGYVCSNHFGIRILSVQALNAINALIEKDQQEEVWRFIIKGKQRMEEYTKASSSDNTPPAC